MGKKPDEIYREISEHRQAMSREKAQIERRVRDDLHTVKDRIGDHTPAPLSDIGDRVAAHPFSYMAGAFGTGIAAGMLTPGLSMSLGRGNGHHDGGSPSRDSDGGSGPLMASLGGALSGTVVNVVEDTVRPLFKDLLAGFRGDDRPPQGRARS
jgi:hypothetical protein